MTATTAFSARRAAAWALITDDIIPGDADRPSLRELLCMAINCRVYGLAQHIIGCEPDVEVHGPLGWTALILAARDNHTDMIAALLKTGSKVNARGLIDGTTALMQSVAPLVLNEEQSARCVDVLLAHGADLEARDEEGRTALHWAVWRGNNPAITLLLKAGADIRELDRTDLSTPCCPAPNTRLTVERAFAEIGRSLSL